MELSEVEETLKAIGERCATAEEIERELNALSAEDIGKIIYETATNKHFEDIKGWALRFIDFADENDLINDRERGAFIRESCLGMLRALTNIWLQSSETQGRMELQAMSEGSQWGAQLSDYGNDLANELYRLVDEITSIELAYKAVLVGRQQDIHFLNDQAEFVNFTEEELVAQREQEAQVFDAWKAEMTRQRAELAASYRGEAEPPALNEEWDSCQLPIPLWLGGYAVL